MSAIRFAFVSLSVPLLSGCLCLAIKDTVSATQAKSTITDKAKLSGLKTAALVGVCHMDEMGVVEGITAHDRIPVPTDASEQMTKVFADAFAQSFAQAQVTSLDQAMAKADAAVRGTVPNHAVCRSSVSPFKAPAEQGLMKSIEPELDVAHMAAAAKALDVDAVFAVMMVPALGIEKGGVKMYSSGMIHSTVYGVDRTGQVIFQQAIEASGAGLGEVTKSSPDMNGRYTITFAPGSVAQAAGVFGMSLASGLQKAIAEAK